jgi:hypothetical protein
MTGPNNIELLNCKGHFAIGKSYRQNLNEDTLVDKLTNFDKKSGEQLGRFLVSIGNLFLTVRTYE